MTETEKQIHDKKLIDKAVKKFKKTLKDLDPQLLSVTVTDIKLCIQEKVAINSKPKSGIVLLDTPKLIRI